MKLSHSSQIASTTTSGLNRFLLHFAERNLTPPPPSLRLQQQLFLPTTSFRFLSTSTLLPPPPPPPPPPLRQTRTYMSSPSEQQEVFKQQKKKRTLWEFGEEILRSEEPEEKCSLTQMASQLWKLGDLTSLPTPPTPLLLPTEPGRPARPIVVPPQKLPRRQELQVSPSVYLLHNLAHIELNAINLGWDTILRFSHLSLPKEFYSDWLSIVADEARHFGLLSERLSDLGSFYGEIPAHGELQRLGEATRWDVIERIGVVQLVEEARGLDAHERLVSKLYGAKDKPSALLVNRICTEEIDHVQKGLKWFTRFCASPPPLASSSSFLSPSSSFSPPSQPSLDPISHFHALVLKHRIFVPSPFNSKARTAADMTPDWYISLPSKVQLLFSSSSSSPSPSSLPTSLGS